MGLLDFLVVHGSNKIGFGKMRMKEISALHFEADFSVRRLILALVSIKWASGALSSANIHNTTQLLDRVIGSLTWLLQKPYYFSFTALNRRDSQIKANTSILHVL